MDNHTYYDTIESLVASHQVRSADAHRVPFGNLFAMFVHFGMILVLGELTLVAVFHRAMWTVCKFCYPL